MRSHKTPVDIWSMTCADMRAWMEKQGFPGFRAEQVYHWLYGGSGLGGAISLAEMTNLPKNFRAQLAESVGTGETAPANTADKVPPGEPERVRPGSDPEKDRQVQMAEGRLQRLSIEERQVARDGTCKYLFGLSDGETIESVFLPYTYGNTVCVSSQVGCSMGCRFCASTQGGKVRDLTAGEMVLQVLEAERERQAAVDHIVVMGMGEPFDNYEALSTFLTILHEPAGRGMSLRHITVSTCGILPGIRRFGEEWPQVNLAISLHGPTDELRGELMPIGKTYPVADLVDTCRKHGEKTGRRVTYEYALIRGINDGEETIEELQKLLRGTLCHVNLIPLNQVPGNPWQGTDLKRAKKIASFLTEGGVPATVRRSAGREIDGACGQLRRRKRG